MEYFNLSTGKNAEDQYILRHLNKIFIKKRGHTFAQPPKGSNIILLLSGGLDSICLWHLLLSKYDYNVYPIHFEFKRRGVQQEKSITYFSGLFKKQFPISFRKIKYFEDINMFTFSSLRKNDLYMNQPSFVAQNTIAKKNSSFFTLQHINNPSRLGFYSFYAYDYALQLKYKENISINSIFFGIMPDDNLVRESTLTMLRSINLTLCSVLGDFSWQLASPIDKKNHFYYSKKDLIKYAFKHQVPLEKTWSCNLPQDIHCGECHDCFTRRQAFIKAKVEDKTIYADNNLLPKILKKITSYSGKKLISIRSKLKNTQLSDNKIKKLSIINELSTIKISPSISYYIVEKEITLINKDLKIFKTFNHSGSFIIKFILKKSASITEICKLIMQQYEIQDKNQVKQDVLHFVNENIYEGYLITD